MPLSVEVKKRRGRPRWEVAVTDPEREAFRVYFEIEQLEHELRHIGTRIEISHPSSALPAAELRDFPMRRWARAALAAVQERVQLTGTASAASAASGDLSVRRDATATPATIALSASFPQTTVRTQEADERLRKVAEAYRGNVKNGLRDPVGAIARAHGVENATARSWVHRARLKGFLGPAVGPTPGEGDLDGLG